MFVPVSRLPLLMQSISSFEKCVQTLSHTVAPYDANITNIEPIVGSLAARVTTLETVRGVSWSEVATVPKRKSHRGLDLDLSWNSEEDIWKGRKKSGGTK